ncbi:MAG: aldose epimerase family protein [Sporomusaceae bacterium]|nr:aldose epimerase family protein [Sporomusaceae bacterium]
MELQEAAYKACIADKDVALFTLTNQLGFEAQITNYGGRLVSLTTPDRRGKLADIVLGYDSLDDVFAGQPSMGATIGRFANRIGAGMFSLRGKSYQLSLNDGKNHLHGGVAGSRFVVFTANQLAANCLSLTYSFQDGEEGYPGTCDFKVQYRLTDQGELRLDYEAVTDQPTIVNFTNHTFWNLAGEGNPSILGHQLLINGDFFTPVGKDLIPTGEIRSVADTPFDFRELRTIGERIDWQDEQLAYGKGYDLNWVLNKPEPDALTLAATVYEPKCGRLMKIFTTEPGLQFYSGNYLTGTAPRDTGKGGKAYLCRSALALETQHFPDSPNKGHFPSTILLPEQKFTSTTVYQFSSD